MKENNECSSDLKARTTLNYRQFLTKIVKFKKVIPLTYDKELDEKDQASNHTQSHPVNSEIKSNSQNGDHAAPDELNNESATQGTQGGHT